MLDRSLIMIKKTNYVYSSICLCFLCFSRGSYSASFELNIYLRGNEGKEGNKVHMKLNSIEMEMLMLWKMEGQLNISLLDREGIVESISFSCQNRRIKDNNLNPY